jgi:beta-glucosidase
MLGGLRARGIQPMVALHHFTNPAWFERAGGWQQAESVVRFQTYVRIVVQALGDLCTIWLTFNEPVVYLAQGWVRGIWPPQKRNFVLARRVFVNLLLAHAAAYHTVHSLQPAAQVSYTHALHDYRGHRSQHLLDRLAASFKSHLVDQLWLQATVDGILHPPLGAGQYHHTLADTLDFVGINYYSSKLVQFTPNPLVVFGREHLAANSDLSDRGRDGSALGKPLYITENGVPDADDDLRPRWLLGHLHQLARARRAGCDIRGYFHWTLVDNFEWTDGWGLRFGLFALDPQTQVRTPRPSAQLYGAIAQENGVTRRMVEQYAPELVAEYFER